MRLMYLLLIDVSSEQSYNLSLNRTTENDSIGLRRIIISSAYIT